MTNLAGKYSTGVFKREEMLHLLYRSLSMTSDRFSALDKYVSE